MAEETKSQIGMALVAGFGGVAWWAIMPDFLSAVVVSAIWGIAVGHFWARNFGRDTKRATPHPETAVSP